MVLRFWRYAQMVLLEQKQGSRSTPVLSFDNSEAGFTFVSFMHIPFATTFLPLSQFGDRQEQVTCRYSVFTPPLSRLVDVFEHALLRGVLSSSSMILQSRVGGFIDNSCLRWAPLRILNVNSTTFQYQNYVFNE